MEPARAPSPLLRVLAPMLAALALALAFAACSTSPAPPPADLCTFTRTAADRCGELGECDGVLATACGTLGAVVSESTLTAARDCLESGRCGVASCVARAQKSATPTAEHQALAASYCASCGSSEADCEARFYGRGSSLPGHVVLPYGAEIVAAITADCTGGEGCQAGFAQCATEVALRVASSRLDPIAAECVVAGFAGDDGEAPLGPDGKPQVARCNASTCDGCCRDDICLPGDLDVACGARAQGCEVCTGRQRCADARCTEPCGPDSCPGCCAGDVCVLGTADAECGTGGQACTACAGSFVCSNRTCIDASCQATCTSGCCTAAGCQPGTAPSACGGGGEACTDCGVGRSCSAGVCRLDRASLWDVFVSFAIVPATNKSGGSWDPFGGAPDPYVKLFTSEGASSHAGQTSVKNDTTLPFWGETPLKGIAASELLSNLTFEIWDSDFDFDDLIGGCRIVLLPEQFDGTLQRAACEAGVSTVPVTLYITLRPSGT